MSEFERLNESTPIIPDESFDHLREGGIDESQLAAAEDVDLSEVQSGMDEAELLALLGVTDLSRPDPYHKVVVPEELLNNADYHGPIYGYYNSDTGYHAVVGWQGHEPHPALKADVIGYIGAGAAEYIAENPGVMLRILGLRENGKLRMMTIEGGTELDIDMYTMRVNLFSRHSGLLETNWMDGMCAVICGCGSVGSCAALQLARSGVGRFVLVDTDCMEIHNVCRHQCSLKDVGRYKVDAVAERIWQINPDAEIRRFYRRIQDVSCADYQDWTADGAGLFIGTCDNRTGNAAACDAAKLQGCPFIACGFKDRAWAGELFVYQPEKGDICYRCAFKTQIDAALEEEERNHNYLSADTAAQEEHVAFVPGLDVDVEYGVTLMSKVCLDLLNRRNPQYRPRLLPVIGQYSMFCATADRKGLEPIWRSILPNAVTMRQLNLSQEMRRCDCCIRAAHQEAE